MSKTAAMMSDVQKASILERQVAGWEQIKNGLADGNPFATLCLHCYGRHAPPRDEICPYEPPPRALLPAKGTEP